MAYSVLEVVESGATVGFVGMTRRGAPYSARLSSAAPSTPDVSYQKNRPGANLWPAQDGEGTEGSHTSSGPHEPSLEPLALSELSERVIEIVRTHGVHHLDEPIQLASGEWSSDFIDSKEAFADGSRLRIACEALIEAARSIGAEFDAVGGLTMGADQFSHGMAIVSGCGWFSVRKVEKGRGTNKLIEGTPLKPGDRVLLVDDVVTMGGSIRKAYEAIKTTGAVVVGA